MFGGGFKKTKCLRGRSRDPAGLGGIGAICDITVVHALAHAFYKMQTSDYFRGPLTD